MDANLKQLLDSKITKYDHLAISIMPKNIQTSIYVLYSFFAELESLPTLVSEPMLGEIRCQWWRDIITESRAESPLAEALLQAIDVHQWPKQTLLNMIDAKIFDLYANPMENTGSFEAYAGHTHSALLQLTANSINASAAKSFNDISGHLGVAYCVAKNLLYFKRHQSSGQSYIPSDILVKHENISHSLTEFANFGLDHYQHAQTLLKSLKKAEKKPVFSAAFPCLHAGLMLKFALKNPETLYNNPALIAPSQLQFQWQLIKANLFKSF